MTVWMYRAGDRRRRFEVIRPRGRYISLEVQFRRVLIPNNRKIWSVSICPQSEFLGNIYEYTSGWALMIACLRDL